MQNLYSPGLQTFLAMLKSFQQALLPSPGHLMRSASQGPVPSCQVFNAFFSVYRGASLRCEAFTDIAFCAASASPWVAQTTRHCLERS